MHKRQIRDNKSVLHPKIPNLISLLIDAGTETRKRNIADSETRESQKAQGNQREDEAQLCTHEKENEEH